MAAGFETLVAGNARIEEKLDEKFHELVLDKLRSAASDMDTLQDLSHDDPRRIHRLENILSRTSEATEAIARDAGTRCQLLAAQFKACTQSREKLNITAADLTALLRLRMAASALAQRASILAESGQPTRAADSLRSGTTRLRSVLQSLGAALFQGATPYDDLLHHYWPTVGVTPQRVGMWASRFDPDTGDLSGVLRKLQDVAHNAEPFDVARSDLQTHAALTRYPDMKVLVLAVEQCINNRPMTALETPFAQIVNWNGSPKISQFVNYSLMVTLDEPTREAITVLIEQSSKRG